MILKLNANKAEVKTLLAEKATLKKVGKDLCTSDQAKLERAQQIVARLEKSIEQQIELFQLSYEKVKGNYVYRDLSCLR